MTTFLAWLAVAYVLVGMYVATLGPLGKGIRGLRREMRMGQELVDYFQVQSRAQPSRWKLVAFTSVLGIAAVIGWGIFLPGFLLGRRRERQASLPQSKGPDGSETRSRQAVSQGRMPEPEASKSRPEVPSSSSGLMFQRTGGIGSFYCHTCGYGQPLTSFLHGFGENAWSCTGYQCRNCHRFREISRRRNEEPDLHCECGGELTRDDIIVCPGCGSHDVDYKMGIIT